MIKKPAININDNSIAFQSINFVKTILGRIDYIGFHFRLDQGQLGRYDNADNN
jgi:hypothetical protein